MNLINAIIDHLFGHKYYLPIYVNKGTFITATSATPFRTYREAKNSTLGLDAFDLIEIISFRSHEIYEGGELK